MASQNDIATDVQKGLQKANERDDKTADSRSREQDKATQFDGNPDPGAGAGAPGGAFKTKDDTPTIVPKKNDK